MATFRYVIVVKVDRENITADGTAPFVWEVRELRTDTTGTPEERSGPTIARGSAPTVAEAKVEAQNLAELLAVEDAYVYDTRDTP